MSGSDDSGMNTLDLLSASRGARRIVRLMLRQRKASYDEMLEMVDLPQEDLDEGLEDLLSRGWVHLTEIEGEKIYSLEIQKKAGSEVTRSDKEAQASSKIAELWDKVDSGSEAAKEGLEAQQKMTEFHKEKRSAPTSIEALDALVDDVVPGKVDTSIQNINAVAEESPVDKQLDVSGGSIAEVTPQKIEIDKSGQPDELFGWLRRLLKK